MTDVDASLLDRRMQGLTSTVNRLVEEVQDMNTTVTRMDNTLRGGEAPGAVGLLAEVSSIQSKLADVRDMLRGLERDFIRAEQRVTKNSEQFLNNSRRLNALENIRIERRLTAAENDIKTSGRFFYWVILADLVLTLALWGWLLLNTNPIIQ